MHAFLPGSCIYVGRGTLVIGAAVWLHCTGTNEMNAVKSTELQVIDLGHCQFVILLLRMASASPGPRCCTFMSLSADTAVSCSSVDLWTQDSSSSVSRTEPAAILSRVQASLVLQREDGRQRVSKGGETAGVKGGEETVGHVKGGGRQCGVYGGGEAAGVKGGGETVWCVKGGGRHCGDEGGGEAVGAKGSE